MNPLIKLSELETELMRTIGPWQDRKNWSHNSGLNSNPNCFVMYSYDLNDKEIYINVGPLQGIKVQAREFYDSRDISGSEISDKAVVCSSNIIISEDLTLLQAAQLLAQKYNLQLSDRFDNNHSYFFQKITLTIGDIIKTVTKINRAWQDYHNFKDKLPTILRYHLLD